MLDSFSLALDLITWKLKIRIFAERYVVSYGLKQEKGETSGETWKIVKETGETIAEAREKYGEMGVNM